MKKKVTKKLVKANADKVKVYKWWAVKNLKGTDYATLTVMLQDGRIGILNARLEHAFNGSEDWCELDVIGESDCTRYKPSQIELPLALRQYIAGEALMDQALGLHSNLVDTMRLDVPCFGTFVEVDAMLDRGIAAASLDVLLGYISDPEAVGYWEESDVENMKRMVEVCRELMPADPYAKLPREESN